MATLTRFEEIEAWQKARELTRAVYQSSRKGDFSEDFALRDQARRASTSVMSNIAEGFERGGTKELLQFLAVAKGSAGELQSHPYVALDEGYLSQQEFRAIMSLAQSAKRLIAGFMNYQRRSHVKGLKYKRADSSGKLQTNNYKP